MPEVPEIAITVQYLKTKLIGKYITSMKILSGRYTHEKLDNTHIFDTGAKIKDPYKIIDIDSKGKFLWFTLKNSNKKIFIANTLGMTGLWSFFKDPSSRIKFTVLSKNKKYNLYFIDQRNFGQINIYEDEKDIKNRLDRLAPDILKGGLSDGDVLELIEKYLKKKSKNTNIVKVLMGDQSAIVSGIGNYLIAEILYDAKINPHRMLSNLSRTEKKRLAHSMRKITKYSYYDNKTGYMLNYIRFMENHPTNIDKRIFPNYLPDIVANGSSFQFNVYGKDKDPKNNTVKKDSIIKNRTIHWVPKIQK
jgi:formamidopyrimidine-DNA glycosylase